MRTRPNSSLSLRIESVSKSSPVKVCLRPRFLASLGETCLEHLLDGLQDAAKAGRDDDLPLPVHRATHHGYALHRNHLQQVGGNHGVQHGLTVRCVHHRVLAPWRAKQNTDRQRVRVPEAVKVIV